MNKYKISGCRQESLKYTGKLNYIKENYQRVFYTIMTSAICYILLILLIDLVIIPSMPQTAAGIYLQYLKDKEYQKAAECFTEFPQGKGTGYEYIKKAFYDNYSDVDEMQVKSAERLPGTGMYKIYFDIKKNNGAAFEDYINLIDTSSSFFGLKKEWKIIFPFKTRNISAKGTEGSVVFMDGVKCGEIKDGCLEVSEVIYGRHSFESRLGSIAKSEVIDMEVGENTGVVELKALFDEDFTKGIDKLMSDFIKGWSDYCMTQNGNNLKPYITDRLYNEFIKGSDRFSGNKYVTSECTAGHGKLETGDANSVFYTIDEKWHLKEVITSPEMLFKDNKKTVLEQIQYIKSRYRIKNEGGIWKIDSAEQMDFRQEIKE